MKFANKYELFELLTTGTVETFLARDSKSSERLLVHIFESAQQRTDQPTIQWVLESFRGVAPVPPGLVVDAGRYTGTAYAYLVTKLPEEAALQAWVKSYEAHQKTRQGPPTQQKAPTHASAVDSNVQPGPPPAATLPPIKTDRELDEFTKAFLAGRSSVETEKSPGTSRPAVNKASNFGVTPNEPAVDPRSPEPGSFTQLFAPPKQEAKAPERFPKFEDRPKVPRPVGLGDELTRDLASFADPAPPPAKPASGGPADPVISPTFPGSAGAGSFTNLFRSSLNPDVSKSMENGGDSLAVDQPKAGEFTAFFRGPFDGERTAPTPDILPTVQQQPRGPAPGDFTILFGKKGGASAEPIAAEPLTQDPVETLPSRSEGGSFTQIFNNSEQLNKPANSYEPPPQLESRTEIGSSFATFTTPVPPPPPRVSIEERSSEPIIPPEPIIPRAPLATPKPSSVAIPQPKFDEPLFSGRSEPEGATRIFSRPEAPAANRAPSVPAGPSEYTQFIRGSILPPAEESPSAAAPSGTAAGKMPGLPKPPAAPKAPPPPKIAAPPAPKVPDAKVDPAKAAAPKVSYLPLILALNGLFLVAILLVLFFALKK
jgi:hypothetical protein